MQKIRGNSKSDAFALVSLMRFQPVMNWLYTSSATTQKSKAVSGSSDSYYLKADGESLNQGTNEIDGPRRLCPCKMNDLCIVFVSDSGEVMWSSRGSRKHQSIFLKELRNKRMKISIESLSKIYSNGNKALNNINLNIESGMFGLLGPNGAGKTTLMRILVTLMKPSHGSVKIGDFDLQADRRAIRSMLGYLPQDFRFFTKLKTWEFLDYVGSLAGLLE